MTLSRRRFLAGAAGVAASLLLPDRTVAEPTDEQVRRFWPGWQAPTRGGLDSFVAARPSSGPLTAAQLEAQMERLWRDVARPEPWDLLYVETDPAGHRGQLGVWTGVAFVPMHEDARVYLAAGGWPATPLPGRQVGIRVGRLGPPADDPAWTP